MTRKYNSTLLSQLVPVADQTSFNSLLASSLGTSRRVRMFYDAAGGVDPYLSGVEVLNIGASGALTLTGQNITGHGTLSGTTVRQAVNLTTGTACLRIESTNGNWVQYSVGLTSASDIVLSANPTATSGFSMKNLILSAPSGLPVSASAGVPIYITLQDWSTGIGVDVKTITLDQVAAPIVFQDAEINAEIGTVPIQQSSDSLVLGAFEFGATRFELSPTLNADANQPVFQVLIACKPYGTWGAYPAKGLGAGSAYDPMTNSTIPPPFKIVIKDGAGTVMHTHELHDGKAINDPTVCGNAWTSTKAMRPWFNVAMMLPYSTARIKQSTRARKYFPGMVAEALRPSQAKQGSSTLDVYPTITNNTDAFNSGSHYFSMPRWPHANGEGGYFAPSDDAVQNDPYLYDIEIYSPSEGKACRISGWEYEPGSISGHSWLSGPGGPRFDRAAIPTAIVMDISLPGAARLKDGTAYSTIRDAWNNAYFNHAHHWVRDVKTLASIPDAEAEAGQWTYEGSYYWNGNPASDPTRAIVLYTAQQSSSMAAPDKDGKAHYNGWAVDNQHSYCQPGLATLLYNSPMHLVSAKLRHNAHIMGQLGLSAPNANPLGYFLERQQAWRWHHVVIMWKLGTAHSLGRSKATIEAMFQTELETLYSQIVVPAITPTDPGYNSITSQAARNLGVFASEVNTFSLQGGGYGKAVYHSTGTHAYYMGQVIQMMVQTGLWDVMKAKSTACRGALEFIVQCFDRYSIDWILDTKGFMEHWWDGSTPPASAMVATTDPDPTVCTSWADWATKYPRGSNLEDWIHNADGSLFKGPSKSRQDQEITQHLRAQWAFMRRDTPGINVPNARLLDACAAYQGYYDTIASYVATQTTPAAQRNADWTYRMPCLGILATPTA